MISVLKLSAVSQTRITVEQELCICPYNKHAVINRANDLCTVTAS